MTKTLTRLVHEDHGQDLIEYAFLALFVAFAAIAGMQAIAVGINSGFSNIGTQVGGS